MAVLGSAAPASAHVTVSSANAAQGGYAKLTFRVPNEKDAAKTVKVEVLLPQDSPIASVSVKPVPGWTAQLDKAKAAAAAPSVAVAVAQTADDPADGNGWAVGLGVAGLAGLVMGLPAYRRNAVTTS